MRIPEPGPLGDTFFDAKVRAMVSAFRVKRPFGGYVETVVTLAIHRFPAALLFPAIHSFLCLTRSRAERLGSNYLLEGIIWPAVFASGVS